VTSQPVGRAIEIATAVALGLVSLVTALGVVQASVWTGEAGRLGDLSADARDQSITIAVTSQLKARADRGSLLEAARLAGQQDAAIAAGDAIRALELQADITTELGSVYDLPDGAFDEWRAAGFPADANPAESPGYLVAGRGEADALLLASARLGDLGSQLTARAGVFGQAALVHALALFLFGIAGINRLRTARFVTLGMGAAVFLFGLFLMSTAY
jgi:hypothetical protein